jgi:hypothetical protein
MAGSCGGAGDADEGWRAGWLGGVFVGGGTWPMGGLVRRLEVTVLSRFRVVGVADAARVAVCPAL